MRYLGIEVDDALAIAEQMTSDVPGQSGHALPAVLGGISPGADIATDTLRKVAANRIL
jgi:hypothetical protein